MERSIQQISSDKNFDYQLESHVIKTNRRTLALSVRDNQIFIRGEKNAVNLLDQNRDMKVSEFLEKLKDVVDIDDQYEYETIDPELILPPLKHKFKGCNWTVTYAREAVSQYMAILGYGHKGSKSYKNEDDQPPFWSDSEAWLTFRNPRQETKEKLTKIMESLLSYYGLDAETHHTEPVTVEVPVKPRAKKQKTRAFIDNDDSDIEEHGESIVLEESKEDLNETVNSDALDELLDDDVVVDANHNKSTKQKQKKITAKEAKKLLKKPMSPLPEQQKSDYELLQDQNIAEKKNAFVSLFNDWD